MIRFFSVKPIVVMLLAIGLSSCGGSKGKPLDINNEAEIMKFLQGKWEFDNTAKGLQHKIEIVGNTMRLYERVAGDTWKSQPTAERKFTLGTPTMDVDKYYHVRYLEFDQGDLPLSFRAVQPMWVVCDKQWGEPAIPYGGGFTYLSKEWKHEDGQTSTSSENNTQKTESNITSLSTNIENESKMENEWKEFILQFTTSLKDRNKTRILSMTNSDFEVVGDAQTASVFLNNIEYSKEAGWSNLLKSIESGFEITGKTIKQTKGSYPILYFKFQGNRWYWIGIAGE